MHASRRPRPAQFRDVGRGRPLVQGCIKFFYEDIVARKGDA